MATAVMLDRPVMTETEADAKIATLTKLVNEHWNATVETTPFMQELVAGKLPMKTLLAPAIRYAREGFPVTELIAHYWATSVPRLSKFPGFTEQFTLVGKAPAVLATQTPEQQN